MDIILEKRRTFELTNIKTKNTVLERQNLSTIYFMTRIYLNESEAPVIKIDVVIRFKLLTWLITVFPLFATDVNSTLHILGGGYWGGA